MFAIGTDGDGRSERAGTLAGGVRLAADPIGYALAFLRRYGLLVALCGLLGLALGAVLAKLTPDRFAATTQLLIDPRDLRVLQNEISPQAQGNDAAITFLESQVRVLTSDSIKRRVIERERLAGDPDFGGPGGGLAARLGLPVESARPGRDPVLVALAAMDRQVLVRRSERTFIIDITTISGDGAKSARVSNQMAETYLEDQAQVRSEAAQRASTSLGARLSELRERVRLAEDKVERYRAANNLVGAGGRLVSDETLQVSNTQLTQARARTADAQAKFDQVRLVRPSSIESGATPEALQSGAITSLRALLGAALTREADAQVLYGAQHPLLISAQAQVRDVRRQIAEELARIVQSARAELERARAAEATIAQQVERLKRETLSSGQAAVQLRELEREADANRQVYQAFLLRARETGEQTAVDTTNARIITQAVAPLEKMGPNRKMMAAIGLIAGFALGALLAVLAELWRVSRLAASASGAAEAAPASGTGSRPATSQNAAAPGPEARAETVSAPPRAAPASAARPHPRATPSTGRWVTLAAATPAAPAPDVPAQPAKPLLVTLPRAGAGRWRPAAESPAVSAFQGSALATESWDAPTSAFARAMMAVRDRLALEETAGVNRKVVVIGLQPGAGASLVALNLTLAHAREKATPLLVDLARGPASLSACIAPDAEMGADDVIGGGVGLIRAALQDRETGAFFLPRPRAAERKPAPCPTSLRAGLFDQSRRFDSVVIDAGALGDGALPHLLTELADDIVVVRPAGMEAETAERQLQRALAQDAGKVRVIVANQGS
jgi:uncharacterized protein involved in exopolysaccharide biosynthesis/Mrp family chromosome partitioning ATPase